MGILDSNIKFTKPLKKTATLWTANNGAVSPGTLISCADYNTLQIDVFSQTTNALITIIGHSNDGGSTLYQKHLTVADISQATPIIKSGISVNVPVSNAYTKKIYLVDVSTYTSFSIEKTSSGTVTLNYTLDQTMRGFDIINKPNQNELNDKVFKKLFQSEKFDLYSISGFEASTSRYYIHAVYENVVVWSNIEISNPNKLFISLNGMDGDVSEVIFNSTNFPNLISGSVIERVIILPFTRNNTSGATSALNWRINVISNKGQIYHNFPARATTSDGTAQANDYLLFDESVIWDLSERWHPTKTTEGDDATLIATGKYKYFPALPDDSYVLHPPISTDNGYSNGGFPATITKTKTGGGSVTFGRFWQPVRNTQQDVSFTFMGGYEPGEKLALIGTYVGNTTTGTRICTFATEDGGRQWYCIYEFGTNGQIIDTTDAQLKAPTTNYGSVLAFTADAVSSGVYQIKKRSQYAPSADDKEVEKTKMFKFGTAVAVSSITGGAEITVVTGAAHGLVNGDIIVFDNIGVANAN